MNHESDITDTMSEPQQNEPQSDGSSSENLCKIFISKTSISALPFTVETSKCLKRFWWCVFAVAMILAVTHIVLLCIDYGGCNKNNKVSVVSEEFQFPAVTFCNVNPMRLSQSEKLDDFNTDCLTRRIYDIDPQELLGTIRNDHSKTRTQVAVFNVLFKFMEWTEQKNDFKLVCKNCTKLCPLGFLYNLASNTKQTRQDFGHQLRHMLIKCSYNDKECVPSQFRIVSTYDYGNCYTWNVNENLTYHSGRKNGLKMAFYLETHEYIPGLRDRQGVRLIIHENQAFPSPYNEGIFLPGGSASTINLKRNIFKRIDAPCEPCVSSSDYMKKYNYTYSRNLCDSLCAQSQRMKACDCFDVSQEEINQMLPNTTSRKCNFTDTNDVDCFFGRDYDASSCGCFNPCTETVFSKEISQVNWPLPTFFEPLLVKVCAESEANCNNTNRNNIAADFLEVEIYFESANADEITEEWDKRWYTFLSDVGGSTGLWLGFTAVSLVELVFIAYAALKYSKYKLFNCKTRKDSPI